MKLTNKKLVIILGALALLFIVTTYFRKNTTKNKLDTNVISIDTTNVSKLEVIKAKSNEAPIVFSKTTNAWEVSQNNITSTAKKSTINNLLAQLKSLKATRLVAKSKDAWKKYQLTDSMATKVRITQNGSTKEVYLGKIKFNAPTGQNPYQSRNISGGTYFRVEDNSKVYLTEGMIGSTFSRPFNSWRNSDFAKFKKDDITQIRFENKNDMGFTLQKKDTIWSIGEQAVNTDKVNQYINRIANKSATNFNDSYASTAIPDYQITVTGNNMAALNIKSYQDSLAHKFYLKSTQNPNVFFESDSTGIQKELFVEKNYFIVPSE